MAEELTLIQPDTEQVDRIVRYGKALSDPIRVRMLALMAQGRGCCGLPSVQTMAVPGGDEPKGICVCEFQERYDLGQSKVSYHLRILREAELVTEEQRGKWTFYSLNRRYAGEIMQFLHQDWQL